MQVAKLLDAREVQRGAKQYGACQAAFGAPPLLPPLPLQLRVSVRNAAASSHPRLLCLPSLDLPTFALPSLASPGAAARFLLQSSPTPWPRRASRPAQCSRAWRWATLGGTPGEVLL